jgi:hypothetical protein
MKPRNMMSMEHDQAQMWQLSADRRSMHECVRHSLVVTKRQKFFRTALEGVQVATCFQPMPAVPLMTPADVERVTPQLLPSPYAAVTALCGMRARCSDSIVVGRSRKHYWPFLVRCCARHSHGGTHR